MLCRNGKVVLLTDKDYKSMRYIQPFDLHNYKLNTSLAERAGVIIILDNITKKWKIVKNRYNSLFTESSDLTLLTQICFEEEIPLESFFTKGDTELKLSQQSCSKLHRQLL